jgi:ABC-type cobalamin/Fe3+-siderophores transport system ATPase subunit
MHSKYKYFGFGLHILSQIEFPEFLPADFEIEDINVVIDKIPEIFHTYHDYSKVFSDISEESYFLNIPNVAKYYASNGNLVVLEPFPGSDHQSIRMFFLSSVMAALLVQRHQILLHASAIIHENELVLFLGESGAGKSSIAAEMTKRGYPLFSDDICVLQSNENKDQKMTAYSSYPMMKLWEKTINALDDERFITSHKIRPNAEKFGYFFHEFFKTKPLAVKKIMILSPNSLLAEYESKKISGIEAFELLSKNTYRGHFILDNQIQKIHFESISQLIKNTEIFLLSRPIEKSDIKTFTDFTEELL